MVLRSLAAAAGSGSGDFVVGLLLGLCIGILVGPAYRSWQSYREWAEASRETRLADRLLERMEVDADLDDRMPPGIDDVTFESAWRTRP